MADVWSVTAVVFLALILGLVVALVLLILEIVRRVRSRPKP